MCVYASGVILWAFPLWVFGLLYLMFIFTYNAYWLDFIQLLVSEKLEFGENFKLFIGTNIENLNLGLSW